MRWGIKERGRGAKRKKKKEMKEQIEKEQIGRKRVKGVTMRIAGRLRGANRATHKVIKWGRQNQQDRLSTIELGAGAVFTKYGTLGLKVQCAKERERGQEIRIIRKLIK